MPLRGGVRRLIAKTILNFNFDYLTPSVSTLTKSHFAFLWSPLSLTNTCLEGFFGCFYISDKDHKQDQELQGNDRESILKP